VKLLALDLGTSCGWAVSDNGYIVSGVWDLRGSRFEGGGMRFVRFRQHLEEMLAPEKKIELVAVEEVRRHIGTTAAHVYGGLLAHVQQMCEARQIAYVGVPVATIKKTATGRGNATKEAMIEAARVLWPDWWKQSRGYTDGIDDEADARFLAVTVLKELPRSSAA
jgi:crossover junction endodeoxyribonuclease RuvC